MQRYIANTDAIIPVGNRTRTYKKGQEFNADPKIYDVYVDLGIIRRAPEEAEAAPAVAPKAVAPKAEAPKAEVPKDEAPKDEAPKDDGSDKLPQTMSELKSMKKSELSDLASSLSLDTDGTKDELVSRIASEIFE